MSVISTVSFFKSYFEKFKVATVPCCPYAVYGLEKGSTCVGIVSTINKYINFNSFLCSDFTS